MSILLRPDFPNHTAARIARGNAPQDMARAMERIRVATDLYLSLVKAVVEECLEHAQPSMAARIMVPHLEGFIEEVRAGATDIVNDLPGLERRA